MGSGFLSTNCHLIVKTNYSDLFLNPFSQCQFFSVIKVIYIIDCLKPECLSTMAVASSEKCRYVTMVDIVLLCPAEPFLLTNDVVFQAVSCIKRQMPLPEVLKQTECTRPLSPIQLGADGHIGPLSPIQLGQMTTLGLFL